MAEQSNNSPAPASGKRKLPLKTFLLLAVVLLLEVVFVLAVYLVAGKPAPVRAQGAAVDEARLAEEPVEELVVADKFPNTRTGRTYLYDTEVYIVIRRKNQTQAKMKIEAMSARIATDIATIISRAEPTHLLEPTRATLTRQIKAALDARLGQDDQGHSIVEEVLMRKLVQFRADM